MAETVVKNQQRQGRGRPFQKGQSGNPAGSLEAAVARPRCWPRPFSTGRRRRLSERQLNWLSVAT